MTPLLETRDLTMRFGGVVAVNGVTFSLREGELRCLIGPNGAGKSAFFKCLTGQLRPTSGHVAFRGNDITGLDPFAIARLGIGIKTQVPSVFDGLSVREQVWLASRRRGGRGASSQAASMLDRLGLADIADEQVGRLAHGTRQLVELAMVVASGPDLILLDEPTAGMSAEETRRTAALINELRHRHALVVVEHDMQFIRMIAGTVTVLHQGRVLIEDEVERVMHDPVVRDVYLGREPARRAPLAEAVA
jgi:branched-chain amino acid transport system ATP-binding protein